MCVCVCVCVRACGKVITVVMSMCLKSVNVTPIQVAPQLLAIIVHISHYKPNSSWNTYTMLTIVQKLFTHRANHHL